MRHIWLLLVCLACVLRAQAPRNLVGNSDFERAFLADGAADGWMAAPTASRGHNGVARAAGMDGGACHIITVPDDAEVTWYTCRQAVRGLTPGARAVASVWVRAEGVRDGSGAYFGPNYYSADGTRISWTDSERKLTGDTTWTRLTQPFVVPPGTVRVDLVLVLHGHGSARFDRAQVELGDAATDWQPRESSRAATAGGPSRPRVAILSDDLPPGGTASDPAYLRELALDTGCDAALLSAADLADPTRLAAGLADVLVLPYGSSFPVTAAGNLRDFLRDGGNLLSVGGYPLDSLLVRQGGAWVNAADFTPDTAGMTTLLDPAAGTAGWGTGGRDRPPGTPDLVTADGAPALAFGTPEMPPGGWLTMSSPALDGLPETARVVAFYGRSTRERVPLAFEFTERDGSRWRDLVDLTPEWRLHALSLERLDYWHDNPSKGRGGAGDRFHPEAAARLAVGITTEFVASGAPYRVEIGRILVGEAPLGGYADVRLNSHFGAINPATFLMPPPDAISICDAGSPLSGVHHLSAAPGDPLLPAPWHAAGAAGGYSATGQTAQGHPGAPLKARWRPLVQALDRYGRVRGTAFALMHNYAGEYAGSTWAYSGISDRDLFARGDEAGAALFRSVLGCLTSGAYLFEARAALPSLRPGEAADPTVRVANLASAERELSVRLTATVAGAVVASDTRAVRVAAHSSASLTFPLAVPTATGDGLLVLSFELSAGGQALDRLETGAALWDTALLAQSPPVRYAGCYLSRADGPQFLLGTQIYWGNATSTGTDPLRWARQFEAIADNGLSLARSFMGTPGGNSETGWRYRDAMVQLAGRAGVTLFYEGVSSAVVDPAQVAERARIAAEAAQRYQASPGWFIDIRNEPSLPVGPAEADSREFREWLRQRYGTPEALRAAWGEDLTEAELDQVALAPMRGSWGSLRAVDTQWFMAFAMRRWTARTAQAARDVDGKRLVSVGHLQGFGASNVLYDPIEASRDMDFANRHYYGDIHAYAPELMQVDLRVLGKAPSTGEFGATSHPGLRAHGVYETEDLAARRYAYVAHSCFGLGGAFAANWHWQDPIEDIFPCGLLQADGAPRDRLYPYRNLGALFGRFRPRYEAPTLWFVVPESHRFGMSKPAVEAAMVRSLRAILALHVECATISEQDLDKLPPAARALIWPVPYCPSDAAAQAVLDFARRGGAVYLSGDVSWDAARKRTRTNRLTDLCGVSFVAERYPDIQVPRQAAPAATPLVTGPLGAALERTPLRGPCLGTRSAGATELARSGDTPLAWLHHPGQGTVLYVTDPLELHTSPDGLLAAFLDQVGIARHALAPDLPAIQSHRVPGLAGSVAHLVFNQSESPQEVTIRDLPRPATLRLGPWAGGAVLLDGEGHVIGAEGQSVTVGGQPLFSGEATCCLVSEDGKDLAASAQVLVMPMGPGRWQIQGAPREFTASVGEMRKGRWQEFEAFGDLNALRTEDPDVARSWIRLRAR